MNKYYHGYTYKKYRTLLTQGNKQRINPSVPVAVLGRNWQAIKGNLVLY